MCNSHHGPIHTRKKIAARKFVKPKLEILEDRLAPAATMMVSFDASSNTLDIQPNAATAQATGAAQATITVIEFSNNSQWLISTSGATLSLGSGTSSGFDLSSDASRLIINPGGSIKVDVDSLNISGPSGTTTNNDIVNLEGVSLSGSLTVSAGTLDSRERPELPGYCDGQHRDNYHWI